MHEQVMVYPTLGTESANDPGLKEAVMEYMGAMGEGG